MAKRERRREEFAQGESSLQEAIRIAQAHHRAGRFAKTIAGARKTEHYDDLRIVDLMEYLPEAGPCVLRMERGEEVRGLVVTAQRSD